MSSGRATPKGLQECARTCISKDVFVRQNAADKALTP